MQDLLSLQSPKPEDEKYAYDIIQKAYWINEKKIEMLDYKKRNKLIENYCKYFNNTWKRSWRYEKDNYITYEFASSFLFINHVLFIM